MYLIILIKFHKDWIKTCNYNDGRTEISPSQSAQMSCKQESQEALIRSPEFCLKLTYRYLLKAGHVPGDTWGWANFGHRGII